MDFLYIFFTENTRGEKVTLRPISRGVSYVSYVLMSKRINPPACGLFFLLCSIEIGEVLLCNGGVVIIRKQTINPLGLQPLPLYFTYVKHMGRKGYPVRDGIFFLPITPRRVVSFSSRLPRGVWSLFPPLLVEIGEVSPCDGGVIVQYLLAASSVCR